MNPWKDFERETKVRLLHFYRKSLRKRIVIWLRRRTILGVVEVRS